MSSEEAKNPPTEEPKTTEKVEGETVQENVNGEIIESNWHETYATFDEMNLKEELLRGIYRFVACLRVCVCASVHIRVSCLMVARA